MLEEIQVNLKASLPYGIAEVVSRVAVTYKVVRHEWFTQRLSERRILPTICVPRCNAAWVSRRASRGRLGMALDGNQWKRS